MYILVINGPNLNMLGIREPDIYGKSTYKDLCDMIKSEADKFNAQVEFFQSNHEGDIVDKIQSAYGKADGIIINPAAYTHTSVAILDALKAVAIPTCEVHISNVNAREKFRQISYVGLYADKTYAGYGFDGYIMALKYLINNE
jgi:3-dehydroquinate dehydratase-2